MPQLSGPESRMDSEKAMEQEQEKAEEQEYLDTENCEVIELGERDGVNEEEDMDDANGDDLDEDYEERSVEDEAEQMDDDVDVEVDNTLVDLEGHTASVYCVVTSPTDNNVIATGGGDDSALIHDVRNDRVSAKFENLGDSVNAIAFSVDGKLAAFGIMSGRIIVVDVYSGKVLYEPEGPTDAVEWLQFHPRGPFLLAGSADCMMYMWNQKGDIVHIFAGHGGAINCGGFTPDGRGAVSGSEDGTIRTWNPKDGACLAVSEPLQPEKPGIICLDMTDSIGSSSVLAIAGYGDGSVQMLNLETAASLARISGHSESVECVKFSPPGTVPRMCASASVDGTLKIWDIDQSRERCALKHENGVFGFKWHPTKPELVISIGGDHLVHVWDALKGNHVAAFSGNRNTILSMDIGSTGEYVVTGGDDHHVRVFSMYQN